MKATICKTVLFCWKPITLSAALSTCWQWRVEVVQSWQPWWAWWCSPISLLPIMSKLIEKHISDLLWHFWPNMGDFRLPGPPPIPSHHPPTNGSSMHLGAYKLSSLTSWRPIACLFLFLWCPSCLHWTHSAASSCLDSFKSSSALWVILLSDFLLFPGILVLCSLPSYCTCSLLPWGYVLATIIY